MLKAIIAGLGTRGRLMIRDGGIDQSRFELVAGVDPGEVAKGRMREIAPDLKIMDDFDKALKEVPCDVVFVLTPAQFHYSQTKAALEAGKHVYVEKPFVQTHPEAIELVQLAEKKGVKLMVGQNMRYVPTISKLREEVASGKLGKIAYMSLFSNRYDAKLKQRLAGNKHVWLLENSTHDWDQILAITQKRPVRVYSREFDTPWAPGDHGGGANSIIEFEDGSQAVTQGGFVAKSTEFRMRIETEKGTIIADSYQNYKFIDTASDTTESVDMEPLEVSGAMVVVGAFADYVEKDIEPDNTGRKNLRLIQLICAAIRSSMTGQAVDIPEASDEPIEY